MGVKEKIISQAVEPRGTLGWVTAWIMPLFSDAYCGDLAGLLQLHPDDEVLEGACGSRARPPGRAAFVFDYYPTKEAARKAAEWWGLPTWTESEVRAMLEKAGFAQIK